MIAASCSRRFSWKGLMASSGYRHASVYSKLHSPARSISVGIHYACVLFRLNLPVASRWGTIVIVAAESF